MDDVPGVLGVMNFCVLIPIHNESKTIRALVIALKTIGLDVAVINDGSEDGSGKMAADEGAIVLDNDRKMGKGFSLRKGFAWAVKEGYDGVITMDGDGQHDPADIRHFLDKAGQDPKMVIVGNRMNHTREMPLVRYWTNTGMSRLISFVCHTSIPDTQCGYRYIGADVLKIIELTSGDFEIETEILMKASKKGFPIMSVPVKTIYRDEKSKINPFKDTIRFMIYFSREIFSKG
jgi:glycosyltransferase involved in cell wall biosynthesis